VNRGLLFQQQGDDERALADYTEAIRLGFQSPGVYLNRGEISGSPTFT
jgi:hypothetical protein